jgi:hypothetical protein
MESSHEVPDFFLKRFSSMYRGKKPSVHCLKYWSYYLQFRKIGKVTDGMNWALETVASPGTILILLNDLSYAIIGDANAFSAVANGRMVPIAPLPPMTKRFASPNDLLYTHVGDPRAPRRMFLSRATAAMRKFIMGFCEYQTWKTAGGETFLCPIRPLGEASRGSEELYVPGPWFANGKMMLSTLKEVVEKDPNVFVKNEVAAKELDLLLFSTFQLVHPFGCTGEQLVKALANVLAYYEQYDWVCRGDGKIAEFLRSDPYRYLSTHVDLVIPSAYIMSLIFDSGRSLLEENIYRYIESLVHGKYTPTISDDAELDSDDDSHYYD